MQKLPQPFAGHRAPQIDEELAHEQGHFSAHFLP